MFNGIFYGEGWATAFSLLAQDCYSQKYSATNISRYNGPFWNEFGYGNDDYNPNVCAQGGEASELQVGRFLYNLVDADQGVNGMDILQISHSKFWSLSAKNYPKTFAEFYQNCLDGGVSLNAMGMLLMKLNIAPANTANLDASTSRPKLTWKRNGGVHYQNDQFIIKFYDKEGIKRTVFSTSFPYTLSQADINFIKLLPGSEYYVKLRVVILIQSIKCITIRTLKHYQNQASLNKRCFSFNLPLPIGLMTLK